MEDKKYQKAWEEFQNKMDSLRKRQSEILDNLRKKLDQQKIDSILNKLKK